ncbi:hypothetical protein N7478_012749 [Penicillium angulare]|uniref:uncharacterized protein n=1 Tax=Penicillium angulare TaxID=116970 RepID=UPI00253FCFFE|nr:uncharacterized protein N7478_012749 [Penicillium angulare]KAJ5256645.1 hypothetical protein N7478_012749 [Penicillium angulare]
MSERSASPDQPDQSDQFDQDILSDLSIPPFSLPFPQWLQTPSPRIAHYERQKRKRVDLTDTEGDGGTTTDAASVTYVRSDSEAPTLTPNEAHQYRVAGLSVDEQLPKGKKYPHGPAAVSSGEDKDPELRLKDLSPWSTPVYYPQNSLSNRDDLHLQHLVALNTVLHTCLLDGDFARAGRAWGLLLREEFQGLPLDLHSDCRWGIGAEILLRRGLEGDIPFNKLNVDGHMSLPFTRKGVEEAKDYYDRLILHHPYLRLTPSPVSALTLYPVMFGLWIYTAQEESKVARYNIENWENSSEEDFDEEDLDSETRELDKKQALIASVRSQELQQAQKIAIRMDSIVRSPPYSDSPEILQLRGMVSLWIGDLLISSSDMPLASEGNMNEMHMNSPNSPYGTSDVQRLAMDRRRLEVDKSKQFFQQANEHRKGVAQTLKNLHFGGESSPTWIDLEESS